MAVVTAITSITRFARISKLILPELNWARKSGSRLDGIVGGISDDGAWHKIRAQERRGNRRLTISAEHRRGRSLREHRDQDSAPMASVAGVRKGLSRGSARCVRTIDWALATGVQRGGGNLA